LDANIDAKRLCLRGLYPGEACGDTRNDDWNLSLGTYNSLKVCAAFMRRIVSKDDEQEIRGARDSPGRYRWSWCVSRDKQRC
jgi:hypothetical protein